MENAPKKILRATPQATNEIEVRGEELGKIIWKGKQWAVTSRGIEARSGQYLIPADELPMRPHTWIHHMQEKNWVDMMDFTLAFAIACEYFEVKFK